MISRYAKTKLCGEYSIANDVGFLRLSEGLAITEAISTWRLTPDLTRRRPESLIDNKLDPGGRVEGIVRPLTRYLLRQA